MGRAEGGAVEMSAAGNGDLTAYVKRMYTYARNEEDAGGLALEAMTARIGELTAM